VAAQQLQSLPLHQTYSFFFHSILHWNIAVFTACRHSSRVVAFLQAVARPKFRGPRSSSIAQSQVWLGFPIGRFQSGGTCRIAAARAQWWSSWVELQAVWSRCLLVSRGESGKQANELQFGVTVNFVTFVQPVNTNLLLWKLEGDTKMLCLKASFSLHKFVNDCQFFRLFYSCWLLSSTWNRYSFCCSWLVMCESKFCVSMMYSHSVLLDM